MHHVGSGLSTPFRQDIHSFKVAAICLVVYNCKYTLGGYLTSANQQRGNAVLMGVREDNNDICTACIYLNMLERRGALG
jgi:hypothetical protein